MFLSDHNLIKYFPISKYTLVDIEHEIKTDILNNVGIVAYIDLILKEKETGRIKIIDIKTSTRGWSSYEKDDIVKQSQLRLYKALYSKKYNIPLSTIDIEFFILKRKLYENSPFPQSHIQIFVPTHTQEKIIETIGLFSEFIRNCFTQDGQYKPDMKHPKMPGKNNKNCKYCIHKGKNCDGVADLV